MTRLARWLGASLVFMALRVVLSVPSNPTTVVTPARESSVSCKLGTLLA